MRRNIFAASALLLWGAALTASAVAQQPVKLGVLNDQTGQAQASKEKIGALSNAGGATINAITQAGEFGLGRGS